MSPTRGHRSASQAWQERTQDFVRHLADLEQGAYEGAQDPAERVAVFDRAVRHLDPVVRDVLNAANRLYLRGTGTISLDDPVGDGREAVWSLSWPEQRGATRRPALAGPPEVGPVKIRALFPEGWTHGHLGGEHVGHWPLQILGPQDAARQRDVLWAIVEAELHEWIYSAQEPWRQVHPSEVVDLADGLPGAVLKSQLRGRTAVRGLFIRGVGSVEVIQASAAAGLDFLIVDAEHAALPTEAELSAMCEIAQLRGLPLLVRIAAPRPELAAKALDLGAAGVIVPRCRTLDEVASVLGGCYLPPLGSRGFSPRTRAASFAAEGLGSSRLSDVTRLMNRAVVVIIQVETAELMEALPGLVLEERIDGLLLGAHDLAVALGTPDADVAGEAGRRIARAVAGHSLAWGLVIRPGEEDEAMRDEASLLVLGSDGALLGSAIDLLGQAGDQ